MRREFMQALQADRQQIFQEPGTSIESLMMEGKIREACERIFWWYQQVRVPQDPPYMEALDQVSTERANIYRCRPPEGLQVPLLVRQFDIEYGIPTEAEVEASVRVLKGGRKGVLSGMHAEDLK